MVLKAAIIRSCPECNLPPQQLTFFRGRWLYKCCSSDQYDIDGWHDYIDRTELQMAKDQDLDLKMLIEREQADSKYRN